MPAADLDQAVTIAGKGKRGKFAPSERLGMGSAIASSLLPMQPDHRYFYGLDAVRFCAATLVALFHLTWRLKPIALVMPVGWVGVQIFFVISGFVIANSAAGATPGKFLRGRFLRLYPVAWICVPITLVCLVVGHGIHKRVGVFTVLSIKAALGSVALVGKSFLTSAYWTLPIELAFYSLILLVLIFSSFKSIERVAHALVALGLIFIPVLWADSRGYISAPWIDPKYGPQNMLLYRHSCYFALGIYFWLWSRSTLSSLGLFSSIVALALAVVEISCRADEVYHIMNDPMDEGSFIVLSISAFAVGVTMIAVTILFASQRAPPWANTIRVLGLMTYPIYLLHESLGGAVFGTLLPRLPVWVSLPLAFSAVCFVAWCVVSFAEPAARSFLVGCMDDTSRRATEAARLRSRAAGALWVRNALRRRRSSRLRQSSDPAAGKTLL
jgi:exopolysaccharide production protein ExoZ